MSHIWDRSTLVIEEAGCSQILLAYQANPAADEKHLVIITLGDTTAIDSGHMHVHFKLQLRDAIHAVKEGD